MLKYAFIAKYAKICINKLMPFDHKFVGLQRYLVAVVLKLTTTNMYLHEHPGPSHKTFFSYTFLKVLYFEINKQF